MKPHILVVDDEAPHRQMLELVSPAKAMTSRWWRTASAPSRRWEKQFYDLILMDIRMSGLGGIEALHQIRSLSPGIPVIMMTAYASVGTAVEALKSGACDYLTKPLDIEELKILVAKALRHRQLEQENRYLKEQLGQQFSLPHHRAQPTDAGVVRKPGAGGSQRGHRAHHGEERDGQGADCQCDPPEQPPPGASRWSRSTARRCPRPCSKASFSGTSKGPSPAPLSSGPGPFSAGRPGVHFPGRNRRNGADHPGQDPARAPGAGIRTGGRHPHPPGGHPGDRRHQPRPG